MRDMKLAFHIPYFALWLGVSRQLQTAGLVERSNATFPR